MTDTTGTGSGMQEADADEGLEQAQGAAAAERYNPLTDYDPEREFKFIETARSEVDETLLGFTRPFAEGIILLIRLSMAAVVWAAAVVPALEAASWFGYTPPPFWHGAVILSVPVLVTLFVLGWLFIRVPIKLKWTAIYIEMYLDDEISNLLIREREASKGELRGLHIGSNVALLKLLRLRMKAFHFWHRISIHGFILNGMFFRRILETPFRSPRLWANGIPVLALALFLSVQAGILIGQGGASGDLAQIARTFGDQIRAVLMALKLGGEAGRMPAAPFMAAGFGLAYFGYWLSRRARHSVTAKLNRFLDTSAFLNPHTHDCSREILAKHEKLIRILARVIIRGRNGQGELGSNELSGLILEEGLVEDGLDDPV